MQRDGLRARRLLDIGSTTALSAMVEIVEGKEGRALVEIVAGKGARSASSGVLARQVRTMLARFDNRADRDLAIEGFCDELQTFLESVPGIQHPVRERRRRAA